MLNDLVLTMLGPDRTGLVEAVASTVAHHDGNWLESRMARLSGQFAGIVHVQVPAKRAEALAEALRRLASRGLTVTVSAAGPAAAEPVAAPPRELTLQLIGHDRPGIVRDVSHALAHANVNVTELETTCYSAPMTGEPLFQADARLTAPSDVDLDALRNQLDDIADRLHLDLTLTVEV